MKNKIKITFLDYDGKILKELELNKGEKINKIKPKRYFYKFIGWDKKVPKYATKNMKFKALYKPLNDNNNNGISDEKEFMEIIKDIINSEEYLKRKDYSHHGPTSVYDHSFAVAYYSYKLSKKLHIDYKSATIGGILHDFYYEDWHKIPDRPFFKKHGFVHAKEALENSKKNYPDKLNKKIENAIERHMFPLNIIPPKYLEAWVVSISDKYVSLDTIKDITILLSFFNKKYQK